MRTRYPVLQELSLPGRANPRYVERSFTEVCRRDARVIGGDLGDLHFSGYTLRDDSTVLNDPVLVTSREDLNEDEVFDLAREILLFSFASIGLETVECG